ncbi:hypothetical protein EPO15_06090 [bacterium]|nr:MAG: hypothetical protein EPO15_06090 [bacterium]
MKRLIPVLAVLAALAGPASADTNAQLQGAAAISQAAAGSGSPEALSASGALAFGEKTGPAAPVQAGSQENWTASQRDFINAEAAKPSAKTGEVPPPGALAKVGSTLKEYTPHLLTAGIGGAAGAVAAKAAGFGLLGGIAAGAGIGLAAMYLYKKGETAASIGAASLGLAGLAVGGPVGGIVGAIVGGLGGWLLKKFFS